MDTEKYLKPGLSHQMEFIVEENHAASHVDREPDKVLRDY